MTFRNPWIDPRIVQVRSAAVQIYLRARGWKPLPAEQPNLLPFQEGSDAEESRTVHVPLLEQARDYPQRMIELVTELALAEGRYAVDVLNDLLQQGAAEAVPASGPALPGRIEPATR
jgi:hypothetical protein